MNAFQKYNILIGWVTFTIAAVIYILTLEPTVSWWDCGEFIACSYKLQIGHPPGAPLYLLLGRVFSLLTSDVTRVAYMINMVSALASAFTILFLFWTITHLVKKLLVRNSEHTTEKSILILGSGVTGALAYAFSDTFWFSAVEAEVYALSSLFTAMVFWAILKWENIANEPHANRWLILIAYLMGLSIGVHLLNLLAIPAIVLVYYFKKYEVNTAGIFKALAISLIILIVMMYGIISGLMRIGTWFELLFVNGLGLPFNSGLWFFMLALFGAIVYGILYTQKKQLVVHNIIIVCLAVILLGYSSYAIMFIRSAANPPIDENNPNNAFSMLYYLNREQYGDRPLLTGHYFDSEVKKDRSGYPVIKEGNAVYRKNIEAGKYDISYRKNHLDYSDGIKLFPRMYSREQEHIRAYNSWGMIREGEKAGFFNNVIFFLNYQIGHMYLRYFMWNFAGRQNDVQSHGSLVNGNWLSGITFIDEFRLGNQEFLPDKYKNQPSRNTYYFFPLLLGLIGLLYHSSKHNNDFRVVMALFIMTGIAIVIYLNQTPFQPRERDYAFAGSFYAFSIWIGIGVVALYDSLKSLIKGRLTSLISVFLSLLLVPGIMAQQNYDDHDRSGRFTARDIAKNYLSSCEKNSIIFTNGDNDTFPLWYVQEVEGFRTDIRIVNLMLLNTDWYIDQMKMRAYLSDPLPISLPQSKYLDGTNNSVFMLNDPRRIRLDGLIEGIKTDDPRFLQKSVTGDIFTVLPTNKFILDVDPSHLVKSGAIQPDDVELIENPLSWEIEGNSIPKSSLIQLDILANNQWKRPIYFVTGANEGALNLENYFRLEGLAYRLLPIKTTSVDNFFEPGGVNTEKLYNQLMNQFTWGRMNEEDVYLDHYNIRTLSVIKFRKTFVRLAEALIAEEKPELAEKVLDRCMELAPHHKVPYDHFISGITLPGKDDTNIRHTGVIEAYYKCGAIEKANNLMLEYTSILQQDMVYYNSLQERFRRRYQSEAIQSQGIYQEMLELAELYGEGTRE